MNKSAVTIGKFEGIHRGHQLLIDEITKVAESKKYDAVFLLEVEFSAKLW